MSQMSLIERKARYSAAYSLMNKMRHIILGREKELTQQEKEVMGDVFDMLTGEEKVRFTTLFKNSLPNMGKYSRAAAVQVMDAIQESGENSTLGLDYYVQLLRTLVSSGNLDTDKRDELTKFLIGCMDVLEEKNDLGNSPFHRSGSQMGNRYGL